MKELPATLLLQPFNFTTLATALYGEAKRGTYEDGAIAALAIVLVGLIPVIVLARVNAGIGIRGVSVAPADGGVGTTSDSSSDADAADYASCITPNLQDFAAFSRKDRGQSSTSLSLTQWSGFAKFTPCLVALD